MAERNTQEREGAVFQYQLAASAVVHMGRMIMLHAGLAKPASAIAAGKVVGIAQYSAQQASGDEAVNAKRGTFLLNNSAAADEITAADVLSDCYVIDDQTVAKTNGGGTRPVAGRVEQVEGSGVWVTFA